MWNNLKLKLYLWWYIPKTRIRREFREGLNDVRYTPEEFLPGEFEGVPSMWVSFIDQAGQELLFETSEEAQECIDQFLIKERKELIEKFNTPKTKYIKYP